jgi:hypothetical protein
LTFVLHKSQGVSSSDERLSASQAVLGSMELVGSGKTLLSKVKLYRYRHGGTKEERSIAATHF